MAGWDVPKIAQVRPGYLSEKPVRMSVPLSA